MITFKKLGKFGRFGNQLFQYAGARLYAESHGFDFALPHWIGCDIFANISPCNFSQKLKSLALSTIQLEDVKSYGMVDKMKFLLGLTNALPRTFSLRELYQNPRNNINFYSYFQDEFSFKLLQEHKEKIKEWFTFKKEIDEQYKKAAAEFGPYTGMHIRWGDLVKRNSNLSLELYLDALGKLKEQRNVYVATDSPELINKLAHLKPLQVKNPLPAIPEYIFDFWMLKNAETIIGGGSTFSWWAAYLSNKNNYFSPPLTHIWPKDYEPEFKKTEI